MKSSKMLFLAATAVGLLCGLQSAQAADVGVSVSIGQPGFYGQIDIGDYPRPVLVQPEPIIIARPYGVVYQPVYLHVPPGQIRQWGSYCGRYGACNRPVYFVQDRWYDEVYAPRYRERHGPGHRDWDEHRGGRGDWDDDHGGHGHGRGHDRR